MFKARIKADSLKEFVGTVGSLVDEAKINVSEDGLQVKAVDPSHVAMIEANLIKSAFDSFEDKDSKNKKIKTHEVLMKVAIALSLIFLIMYVAYHMTSEPTPFGGDGEI